MSVRATQPLTPEQVEAVARAVVSRPADYALPAAAMLMALKSQLDDARLAELQAERFHHFRRGEWAFTISVFFFALNNLFEAIAIWMRRGTFVGGFLPLAVAIGSGVVGTVSYRRARQRSKEILECIRRQADEAIKGAES